MANEELVSHPLVMIEDSLWWNFERWCRLHGYVSTPISGTAIVHVHKPGHEINIQQHEAGDPQIHRSPDDTSPLWAIIRLHGHDESDPRLCRECHHRWPCSTWREAAQPYSPGLPTVSFVGTDAAAARIQALRSKTSPTPADTPPADTPPAAAPAGDPPPESGPATTP